MPHGSWEIRNQSSSAAEEFAVKLFFFLQTTSLPATGFGWEFFFPRNMTFRAGPHDPCAGMAAESSVSAPTPGIVPWTPDPAGEPEFCVSGAHHQISAFPKVSLGWIPTSQRFLAAAATEARH